VSTTIYASSTTTNLINESSTSPLNRIGMTYSDKQQSYQGIEFNYGKQNKLRFEPIWKLTFHENSNTHCEMSYNEFKERFHKIAHNDFKIRFDDENKTLFIGHSLSEFRNTIENDEKILTIFEHRTRSAFRWKDYKTYPDQFSVRLTYLKGDLDKEIEDVINKGMEILSSFKGIDTSSYEVSQKVLDVFEKFQGLIVGDGEVQSSPKQFLCSYMKKLVCERHLGTLFVENVFYDTMQGELDNYLMTGNLSAIMCKYLSSLFLDLNPNYNLLKVVKAAQKEGVRVVGLDTQATHAIQNGMGMDLVSQCIAKNYKAAEIIEKEKGNKNYIVLINSNHVSTMIDKERLIEVPGLSEILGCPNIVVEDCRRPEEKNALQFHVTNYKNLKRVHLYARVQVTQPTVTG